MFNFLFKILSILLFIITKQAFSLSSSSYLVSNSAINLHDFDNAKIELYALDSNFLPKISNNGQISIWNNEIYIYLNEQWKKIQLL